MTRGDESREPVRLETRSRCVYLTLDQPPLNVLDLATLNALDQALDTVSERPDLHMLVILGGGTRAFCAGVAIEDHTGDKIPAMLDAFHGALRRLFALELITVAAIDGHCLGGGMELAAVCDLVIATERSTFGQPEIGLACFPPVAAALYPTLFGPGRTYDLLLTGRKISSRQAEAMGFVARRLPDGELSQGVDRLVGEITDQSLPAVRATKKAIRAGQPQVELFDRALAESERIYLEELTPCADLDEGVRAFLEKRPPRWQHA